MFDIGFWELMLVGIVALLVVGPEELPALLRTAGTYVGKARRFIGDVRSELDMEVNRAEEIKRRMTEESRIAELHEVIDETKATIPVGSAAKPAPAPSTTERSDDVAPNVETGNSDTHNSDTKKDSTADHGNTP